MLARSVQGTTRAIPQFSHAATERLLEHDWPGNVRELDNLMQRALILQHGDVIEVADLRFESGTPAPAEAADGELDTDTGDSLNHDLKTREQCLIIEALKLGHGSRKRAAERLGISPRTLRYKLARMRAAGIAIPG